MTPGARDGGRGASPAAAAGDDGRWDETAIAEVYRRCGRLLFGTALRLLRRSEEAEDVVHEAFIALMRNGPPPGEGNVAAWLHRVAVNQCLDRLRHSARWKTAELDATTPANAGSSPSLRVDLERAVAALPERARLVFLLHDLEGHSHETVGELLGIEVGTSKSQLARARTLLRAALAGGRADRP